MKKLMLALCLSVIGFVLVGLKVISIRGNQSKDTEAQLKQLSIGKEIRVAGNHSICD